MQRIKGTQIKKTFAYFNKALSFYSHFVHIFTVYYKRSRKDAPFYFRLQSPSPKGCRHPFPYWKKNIERKKQTTTYIWFIIVIYPPLYRKSSPNRLCKIEIRAPTCNNAEPISKMLRISSLWRSLISITYLLSHATTQSPSQKYFAFPRCGARQISAIKRTAYHASM